MKKIKVLFVGVLSCMIIGGIAFAGLDDVKIHGFTHMTHIKSNHNSPYINNMENGSDAFSETFLNFSSRVNRKLKVGLQLIAREFGDIGNSEVALDWAFGDYKFNRQLGLRVGKVKREFGFYNAGRDVDMLRTSILMPQSVYPEDMRDAFLSYYGAAAYGSYAGLDYTVFTGAPSLDKDENVHKSVDRIMYLVSAKYAQGYSTGIGDIANFRGVNSTLENIDMEVSPKPGYAFSYNTPVDGLKIGFSNSITDFKYSGEVNIDVLEAGTADYSDVEGLKKYKGSYKFERAHITSLEYVKDAITFSAEYVSRRQVRTYGLPNVTGMTGSASEQEGFYGSFAYRFNDLLELGTYYDVMYPEIEDRTGTKMQASGYDKHQAWRKDLCLMARFDIDSNFLIKVENHSIDGTAEWLGTLPGGSKRFWNIFAVRASYNF